MTSTSALLDNSALGTSTVDPQVNAGTGLPNPSHQTRDLQQLNSRLDEILSRTKTQPTLGARSPQRGSESYLRSSPLRYSAIDPRTIAAPKTVTFSPTRVSHIDTSYIPHYAHTYLERPVHTSYVNAPTTYKTASPAKDLKYAHYEPVHYTQTATRVVDSPSRSRVVKPATYHEETVKEVAYETQKVVEPYTYTTTKVVQPEPVVYEKVQPVVYRAPEPTVSTRIVKPATYHEETVQELAYQTQRVVEPYTYTTTKVVQPDPITYEKIVDTHYEPQTVVEPARYVPREVVHPPTYHTETVQETSYQTHKVQEPYQYSTSKLVEPEPVTYATTRVGEPVHHSTRLIGDSPKKTTSLNDLNVSSHYRPYESTLKKSPAKVETTKTTDYKPKSTYSPTKSYSTVPTSYAPVSSSPYYPQTQAYAYPAHTHAYPAHTHAYPAQTHAYPTQQYVPGSQYGAPVHQYGGPTQQYAPYQSATRTSPKSYLEPDRRNAPGRNYQGGLGRLENDVESMTFDDVPADRRKGTR